jgi:hypothetical protein
MIVASLAAYEPFLATIMRLVAAELDRKPHLPPQPLPLHAGRDMFMIVKGLLRFLI